MPVQLHKYNIGAFILQIAGMGAFTVVSFQLTKAMGMITACTIGVSDCTKDVTLNSSSYPKKLGSIKSLFQTSQKTQNIGKLMDVKLEQYTATGKTVWFTGKLCVVTPMLDTSFGVKAGLQCYCMGKACMLMYQPSSDFIYVPSNVATDVATLQNGGAFTKGGLQEAMFASSFKPDINTLAAKASAKDSILQMLNKVLQQLSRWRNQRGQALGAQGQVNLADYFTCNVHLTQAIINQMSGTAHPYVRGLVQDFANGFYQGILFQAVVGSLQGDARYLTYIPSSIESGEDMLEICPSYIGKFQEGFILDPQDMLACNVSVNPQQHLRTPTCVYIRAPQMTAWQAQDKKLVLWKQVGSYILPGATTPYRLKVLDVPSWLTNVLVEKSSKALSQGGESRLKNETEIKQDVARRAQKAGKALKENKEIQNKFAKTVFFHTYMLDKLASINLAISEKTLKIDNYIGKSILFEMPVEASQLGKKGSRFYGRVQDVTYSFQAAQSPKAKSALNIRCSISGVTSQDAPSAALFQDDGSSFIYKRG